MTMAGFQGRARQVRVANRSVEYACQVEARSNVHETLRKSVSPLWGTFVPGGMGLVLSVMGVDTVLDTRNSRLP